MKPKAFWLATTKKDLEPIVVIDSKKKKEIILKLTYATCDRKKWRDTGKYLLM